MSEPTIALVFSPEHWVERLHRHLADHGGARVRQVVLDPTLALEDAYDTLVVSHRWPGLTPVFVAAVHERGRCVLGVFDVDEPAGRDHLVRLGVDATIPGDAPVAQFVHVLGHLTPAVVQPAIGPADDIGADWGGAPVGGPVVVTGLPGAGTSEVALALAASLANRGRTVFVDADEHSPSLVTRLGLALEPNLRSAIDAVEYGVGDLRDTLVPVAAHLDVVPGFPGTATASQVRPTEVVDVLHALATDGRRVVVETVGGRTAEISRAVTAAADTVVVVAAASPVGVARLLAWVAHAREQIGAVPLHVVCNRAPGSRFRRAEIEHEIRHIFSPTALWFVPTDHRVDDASWVGTLVARGPFHDAVARLARGISAPDDAGRGVTPSRRRARRAA